MRTIPNINNLFKPLEDIIRLKFIPSITGQPPPNDQIRDLLSLPPRLGGIAIANPTTMAESEFSASSEISRPLSFSLRNRILISQLSRLLSRYKSKLLLKKTRTEPFFRAGKSS